MATETAETAVTTPEATGVQTDETPSENADTPSSGGGLKAWLPLLVTAITMPVLAYVTTVFVLLPKMQKAVTAVTAGPPSEEVAAQGESTPAASATKPEAKPKDKEKGKEAEPAVSPALKEKGVKVAANGKTMVPLNKILVNVAGSMGSRYLLTSVTLASNHEGFADLVTGSEAQLLDLAAGVLGSKTLTDLEKPDARNIARTELLTVFNNALGAGTVQEVYFTEFAVQ